MELLATAVRRAVLLALLAAIAAAAWSWWREQTAPPTPARPAEWPPLPPRDQPAASTSDASAPVAPASPPPAPAPTPAVTEAAADAPPASASWVAPLDDGSTPPGYPVKVKESSGIYHVPGGRFHERTRADRCYVSAEAAEADGYRRSKT